MKIFYLKKDKILKKLSLQELESFSDGRSYSNKDKYIEHLLGLYLLKTVLSKFYAINDISIIYDGKKPMLESGEIKFSLSHSGNIVLAVFCRHNVGVDIENMTERDFQKFAKRYNMPPTKDDFYRFWTNYEAEIKLGNPPKWSYSSVLENNYMLSVVSDVEITSDKEFIEI